MKLYELEYQLALARAQGAEDNALVAFHIPASRRDDDEPITYSAELSAITFTRYPRHEIVLS